MLAEAAVELPVVPAVHVAVPVEVEIPEVTDLAGALLEHGPEAVAIQPIHIAVAVTVAEQPEEGVNAVAALEAVAVGIDLAPQAETVADLAAVNGERVTAIGQRGAVEANAREGDDRHRPALDHRGFHNQADRYSILVAQLEGPLFEGHPVAEGDRDARDAGALRVAVVDHDARHRHRRGPEPKLHAGRAVGRGREEEYAAYVRQVARQSTD